MWRGVGAAEDTGEPEASAGQQRKNEVERARAVQQESLRRAHEAQTQRESPLAELSRDLDAAVNAEDYAEAAALEGKIDRMKKSNRVNP